MQMVLSTIFSTVILVVAITIAGFFLGKLNKFADSDELIEIKEEG